LASLYTGMDRVHSKVSSKLKKQIESFIKTYFTDQNYTLKKFTLHNILYNGWMNFKLVEQE
jgi:hypothetical protein